MKPSKLAKRFIVDRPERFKLSDIDPGDTAGLDKDTAKTQLGELTERLVDLQQRLYAEDKWAVLVVLQGVDASGKDGTISHVFNGLNPQGCIVHAFKAPTPDELDHDFLWRAALRLPRRGDFGVFNRSYYEETLVVRVHPEFLAKQRLPPTRTPKEIWRERFEDINAFERHLVRSGTVVLKFHLRISKDEQKQRLLERLDDPSKRWKFAMQDIAERKLWDRYMDCYEDMIRATSTPEAPWHVVPADHKWLARVSVASVIVETLDKLNLAYPKFDGKALREMERMRKALKSE